MGGPVRIGVSVALSIALVLGVGRAAAQPGNVAMAREAYDRGAAAYDRGDYPTAARQLARADALVANDVTLELALKAAMKADDPLIAMDLVTRAESRTSATLRATREEARGRMGSRVGRLTVTCAPGLVCAATVDDGPFPVGEPRWVLPGPHDVVVEGEGGVRQRLAVRVEGGGDVPVRVTQRAAPLPAAVQRPPSDHGERATSSGVSTAWFWAGAGATAVLGTATALSALDTRSKHERFAEQPSASLSAAGADAQLRTNLLLAGTAAVAVATAVIGLFVVRWSSAPALRSSR